MSKIEGRAKKYDGTAIDYVSLFRWADGKCIAQVTPDATGAWEYEYFTDLNVGITYVADGCEPITHGPYDFISQAMGYRWWRIKNITVRNSSRDDRSVAELRFIKDTQVISNDATKMFSSSSFDSIRAVSAALDNDPNTYTKNSPTSASGALLYYIGYVFDEPTLVTHISMQMRQDMTAVWGFEWQTADIEVSSDGVTWTKYGTIEPRIAQMDLSVVTTPIITI